MNDAPAAVETVEPAVERDMYRRALIQIADAESGVWGVIARDVLRQVASLKEERRVD